MRIKFIIIITIIINRKYNFTIEPLEQGVFLDAAFFFITHPVMHWNVGGNFLFVGTYFCGSLEKAQKSCWLYVDWRKKRQVDKTNAKVHNVY